MSRQTIGAIEGGRHRPGVDAALALGRAVGRSVESLFAPPNSTRSIEVLQSSAPPRDRSGVLAARVGDQLVHIDAAGAMSYEGWPQSNAVLDGGVPALLPGADLDGFVVVGCDPALGLAASLLPSTGPQHVIAVSGSTTAALDAVAAGRAHAAVVHGPGGGLPAAPDGMLRVHLARWQVGLALHPGTTSLAEIAERKVLVAQREPGASSQRAFAAAVRAEGASELPPGPIERGHIEVARKVAAGVAAGVTMEPAALSHGLDFAPLETHAAELWIDARWRGHPAAEALGRLLRSAAFTARLALVGGYDLADIGDEITT